MLKFSSIKAVNKLVNLSAEAISKTGARLHIIFDGGYYFFLIWKFYAKNHHMQKYLEKKKNLLNEERKNDQLPNGSIAKFFRYIIGYNNLLEYYEVRMHQRMPVFMRLKDKEFFLFFSEWTNYFRVYNAQTSKKKRVYYANWVCS